MPVEAKPLFRPDVLRPHLQSYVWPANLDASKAILAKWAGMLATGRADKFKEQELLPDFLADIFCQVLGYSRPVDNPERFTISPEKHVPIDGKYADAVLGNFRSGSRKTSTSSDPAPDQFVVALEGKGPLDPLDRPFAGRKMSAVDQGYRYAINLPCDWIIVTSMRQTRLYFKGADQYTYERFDTEKLASDTALLKKFLYLLGADRVVPETGRCHLYSLLTSSEKVGKELTKDFYFRYAEMRQNAFEHLCGENPATSRNELLSATQKLLDRILFCSFCEDRGLLPADTIKRAYEHRDPYHPRPIWDNFRGLFRAIDTGNAGLDIPAYNGGLFALDNSLDNLKLSDAVCGYFHELSDYDYRPAGEVAADDESAGQLVDVDILGHIFEQSITDLERLRNELEGRVEPLARDKLTTRRKKEGAFYTPAFITRYIVEQALGSVLQDRFEQLRQTRQKSAKAAARSALADPAVYDLETLKKPQREALVNFWEAWQDELKTVRVVDPACGSGAFLIEAFDQLHKVYQISNDRLEELRGSRSLFDPDKQILQHNLYGVDLNEEAIEICRLSLWIKTAARGKQLTSLDHTIRVGNLTADLQNFWGGYLIEFKLAERQTYTQFKSDKEALRRHANPIGPAGASTKFTIDISAFEYCERRFRIRVDEYDVYVYTPALIVAEKLRAICQQMTEYNEVVKRSYSRSGRARDFVDICDVVDRFQVATVTADFYELLRKVFEAKRVPLYFLGKVADYSELHRTDFSRVLRTVLPGHPIKSFDEYFNRVVAICDSLEPLWHE